jgi:hypothetical protein
MNGEGLAVRGCEPRAEEGWAVPAEGASVAGLPGRVGVLAEGRCQIRFRE